MVMTLLQQCRVHKDRAPLSAGIARHIVFDKKTRRTAITPRRVIASRERCSIAA
jgi:hypothetical protein